MADVKISALPAATTPLGGTEVLPVVQSGSTVKVSVANLTAGRAVSASSLTASGALLAGTTSTFDDVSFLIAQFLGGASTKIAGTGSVSQMSFFNDNGRVGFIGSSGSATSYNTSSDYRLKENIANADDAASLIDALQVRKFDWKVDSSHQRYGFVAQELVEVAPEAVHQPADPDEMMAVDYSKLVPMLIKEVQSLRARVAQLEASATKITIKN